ncbi:MAG: ABC transporter substrate-binding protein [Rhodopseudomonas sp.]|uniref:ABC transporter substrate-binding protein n=1 Tax=Rhodopseudomonas sp. TaxID=1078 RepID=UPI001848CD0C|nr:ABC transporter substrate-binding protein [Rhodopseudomonas sp.]NVN88662.1 ABC transporter substrate-binding protein [Rhodopseudomonas sp.]
MRRRDFLGVLGGVTIAVPLAARAQQDAKGGRIARIGILLADSTPESSARSDVLVKTLADLGYIEGKTAQLMLRFPETRPDFAKFARELIDNRVDVIVSVTSVGAYVAKQLTSSVPIVFVYSADPVGLGLVESLPRPGGNVTGLSLMGSNLIAKRLDLLREAVPTISRVTFLFDPSIIYSELSAQQSAAKALGLQLRPISTPTTDAIDRAFVEVANDGTEGVTVATQPMMTRESARIAVAALVHRIPTVGYHPGMSRDGLLMSYGQDFDEYLRKAAVYVDKILKGARPADLPVEQPTVLKLAINLKTAKTLGVTIPTPLLIAADELIE